MKYTFNINNLSFQRNACTKKKGFGFHWNECNTFY